MPYQPTKPQPTKPKEAPKEDMPPPLSNPHGYQTNGLKKNRNFTPI